MFSRLRRNRQLRKVKTGDGSALKDYRFWQPFSRSLFFIELEAPEPADDTGPPDGSSPVAGANSASGVSPGAGKGPRDAFFSEPVPAPEYVPPPAPFVPPETPADAESVSPSEPDSMPRFIPSVAPDPGAPSPGAPVPGTTSTYAVDVHYFADYVEGTFSSQGPSSLPRNPPVALYRDGVQIYRSNQPASLPVPGGVIEVATSMYGLSRMHYVPRQGPERLLRSHPRSAEGLRARFGHRFPGASSAIGVIATIILLVSLALVVPQLLEAVTQLEVVAERVGTFTSPLQLPGWATATLAVAAVLAAMERALTLRHHWLIDADATWTSFG